MRALAFRGVELLKFHHACSFPNTNCTKQHKWSYVAWLDNVLQHVSKNIVSAYKHRRGCDLLMHHVYRAVYFIVRPANGIGDRTQKDFF